MLILLFCIPLGLLSLYLAWLGWGKNRQASLVLLLVAAVSLGLSAAVLNFIYLTRHYW